MADLQEYNPYAPNQQVNKGNQQQNYYTQGQQYQPNHVYRQQTKKPNYAAIIIGVVCGLIILGQTSLLNEKNEIISEYKKNEQIYLNKISDNELTITELNNQISNLQMEIALHTNSTTEEPNEIAEEINTNHSHGNVSDAEIKSILEQDVVEVDANTIVSLYKENSNEVAVNQKYHKKHIQLRGKVKSINSYDGYIEVALDNDKLESWFGIECIFENNTCADIIAELNIGDYITINGVGYNNGSTFSIYGCNNITNIDKEIDFSVNDTNVDDATLGEKNALKAAKSYLELFSFSKKELHEQLEWEGYSESEIEYALEKVGY